MQGGELRRERKAGEAGIKAGHLLTVNGAGAYIKHSVADGVAEPLFALEALYTTSESLPQLDVPHNNGDTVPAVEARQGDVIYTWLANTNSVTDGVTRLVSNGDGTLKAATVAATTLAGSVVAVAGETINNTSGAAVRVRVVIARG